MCVCDGLALMWHLKQSLVLQRLTERDTHALRAWFTLGKLLCVLFPDRMGHNEPLVCLLTAVQEPYLHWVES